MYKRTHHISWIEKKGNKNAILVARLGWCPVFAFNWEREMSAKSNLSSRLSITYTFAQAVLRDSITKSLNQVCFPHQCANCPSSEVPTCQCWHYVNIVQTGWAGYWWKCLLVYYVMSGNFSQIPNNMPTTAKKIRIPYFGLDQQNEAFYQGLKGSEQ